MILRNTGAVLVGVALLMAGCSTPSALTSISAVGAPNASAPIINEDTGKTLSPAPSAGTLASRAAAIEQATAAMTAYGSSDKDGWFARLEPFLALSAAQDYTYTDPRNVPTLTVKDAQLVETETVSEYIALVDVTTTAGVYEVLLSQSDEAPAWLVETITPPAEG